MKKRGYTIVEMLVVLAIIALMVAIVVPRFAVSQKGTALKGAATEVMSALRTARRLAITKRNLRALAIDMYSIPAQFVIMREKTSEDLPASPAWIQEGELRQLPENVAIVAITDNPGASNLDARRTDDNDFNGIEDTPTNTSSTTTSPVFNPSDGDNLINPIYRLIRFYPTGTADIAVIYLWNIKEERRELPSPGPALVLSNFHTLGSPPGVNVNTALQSQFFSVANSSSPFDSYYYTVVVNRLTGGVMVYDYAWGNSPNWDRKKDGS